MQRASRAIGAAVLCALVPLTAIAADDGTPELTDPPAEAAVAKEDAPGDMLDWYAAWAHAVRLDVAPGRYKDRDLGAGGLGLQWEWWPTQNLAYTTRIFMQTIAVDVPGEWESPAKREAAGITMGLQGGTPGPVKLVGGVGVGVAFVNGRLPPSDRWRVRAVPMAGVLRASAGISLMVHPITLHALGQVHLYSEGPAVFSLSFGGGPMLRPSRRDPDLTR